MPHASFHVKVVIAGMVLLFCSALIGIGVQIGAVAPDAAGKCACGIYPGGCNHNSCDG